MAEDFRYGGLVKVAYSDDGDIYTDIAGEITDDSTFNPSEIESNHTIGTLQAAYQMEIDVGFFDFQDYATLRDLKETPHYFRFEFEDGKVYKTQKANTFKVRKQLQVDMRQGLGSWRLIINLMSFDDILQEETQA